MPMTLFAAFAEFMSIAILTARMDSANRDSGIVVPAQYIAGFLARSLGTDFLSVPVVARASTFSALAVARASFFWSEALTAGTSDKHGSCRAASICADVRKT